MELARDGDRLRINFDGVLQVAAAVGGPWVDVMDAVSPRVETPGPEPARFYRARAAADDGIFASRTVVAWALEGPFQQHFDLAFAGVPDGFFPPRREKPYFDGTLRLGAWVLPVRVRVRGNSSLQECPFPKLKFKVGREDRVGTPFAEAREIKIGTHCAEGGRGTVGRLRDERAAAREALAYEAMELLGFVGPRVRRASITYHDTSPDAGGNPVGWVVERSAVMLDDIEVVAERQGARVLADDELTQVTAADLDEQLLVDLQLLHAFLGNWDYRLAIGAGERGVWNTDVLEYPDGTRVAVAGDFDLASWVTGVVRSGAPRDYHPELADVEREARYTVEQVRRRSKDTAFIAGRDRFERKRAAIEALVTNALVDEAGRTNALRHVTAFQEALAAVAGR